MMNRPALAHGRAAAVAGRQLRRNNIPAALPLLSAASPPASRAATNPRSPFSYHMFSLASPVSPPRLFSPSAFASSPVFSPDSLTYTADDQAQRTKLENITRCLGQTLPSELTFPSFGQVSEQAASVSFLDLYRRGTKDDELSPVYSQRARKSPAARVSWRISQLSPVRKQIRDHNRRRSGSVGSAYSVAEVLEMRSPHVGPAARPLSRSILTHAPSHAAPTTPPPTMSSPTGAMHPFALVSPGFSSPLEVKQHVQRVVTIATAKATILDKDARHMTEFRLGFSNRPLARNLRLGPSLPSPSGPLPSPPLPSALLDVKSPAAPYWVKDLLRPQAAAYSSMHPGQYNSLDAVAEDVLRSAVPREMVEEQTIRTSRTAMTPRTRRTQRRQGWSGNWMQGSMTELMESFRHL